MDIEQELLLRNIDQQHDATWRCLDHAVMQRSRVTQAHGLLPVLGALLAGQKAGMQAALFVGLGTIVFCLFVSAFTAATTCDLRILQMHLDQSSLDSRRRLSSEISHGFASEHAREFQLTHALSCGSDPMKAVVKSSFGLCVLDSALVAALAVLSFAAGSGANPNRWSRPSDGTITIAVLAALATAVVAAALVRAVFLRKEAAGEAAINAAYYADRL